MRLVFMGTPGFAAVILDELRPCHEVVAVYTRPDAVRGRGRRLEPSPVKKAAEGCGLAARTPRTLRDPEVQRELAALEPDVVCVAAFGALLPKEVLELPRFGCLNVHASLLPRWRGAAPVERAILAGDEQTGVCVMRMEEGLDTGAYCACRTALVGKKGACQLTDELARLGAQALLGALEEVEQDSCEWTEQDEARASYASKLGRHELDLAPSEEVSTLVRKVRASSPAHPSRALLAGRGATVLGLAALEDERGLAQAAALAPGRLRFCGKRLFLGGADGAAEVLQVKPDGKQAMEARAFALGIQGGKDGDLSWEASHA